ncbi:MAG TPA: hypothetical protein VHU88_10580 [Sporichthyaceae bacterium]|nr:hypothetical protein [Sporichthyaceae bacterium]
MANLTIAVDDDVLRRARVRAADQGTSVNAVLRDELIRYAAGDGSDRAADEFLAFARANSGRSDQGQRGWSRDELWHERLERA